jgi:hypothetical protein
MPSVAAGYASVHLGQANARIAGNRRSQAALENEPDDGLRLGALFGDSGRSGTLASG